MLARYSISNRLKSCTILSSVFCKLYATSNASWNPNQGILDLLQRDKEAEEKNAEQNPFKVVAFHKAIKSISNVQIPIQSGNEVMELPGVGPRIIARINKYLCSDEDSSKGTQSELRKSRALDVLQGIPGIGPIKAKKLVDAGCVSVFDLRTNKFDSILTKAQIARLKYLGLEECKTSRQEAEDVLGFCRGSLDSKYEMTLIGDYRRGAVSFTDIHLMISHPGYVHIPLPTELPGKIVPKKRGRPTASSLNNPLHIDVIPLLYKRGLVAESISVNSISWQGIIRLPIMVGPRASSAERIAAIKEVSGQYRMMHITIVPQKCRGAGLLSLTGDRAFEKNMSDAAKQLGLHLNSHGLWSWHSNENGSFEDSFKSSGSGSSLGYWRLVKSATEHDIFEKIGMDFIEPERRNFLFVSGKCRQRSTD